VLLCGYPLSEGETRLESQEDSAFSSKENISFSSIHREIQEFLCERFFSLILALQKENGKKEILEQWKTNHPFGGE
jgi:hypothetical protein